MNPEALHTSTNSDFTIDCNDIILREYKLEDLDALYNLTQQPEIKEFLPDWDVPKEQRLDWLINYEIPENQKFIQAVSEGGDIGDIRLRLGIILKETSEFIGWCCTGIKDELPDPKREVMYAISKDHRSQGYTTQAVHGLIKYLFENTHVEELCALALVHNVPSNKVIQKCGFVWSNILEMDGMPYNSYTIHKNTWMDR
ncbi:MAG: GNAT family N-acetyltransferase [Bacillota bacterium]